MQNLSKRPVSGALTTLSDAGFSLVEMIVALGIMTMVVTAGITATRALSVSLNASVKSIGDEQFLSSLETQLRRDATSSLGMMTIPASAPDNISSLDRAPGSGASATPMPSNNFATAGFWAATPSPQPLPTADPNNLDTGIEFAVTDAQHRWHRWNYRLQNGELRLTQNGITRVLDTSISRFTAEFIPAERLLQASETADAFKKMPKPMTYTYNLDGQQITNGVVRLGVVRGNARKIIMLSTRVAPSGFGIEAGPQWRPIVWREGVVSKFVFGSDSHYNINGAVQYSTDNWRHAKTWCSHTIASNDDVSSENTQREWVELDKSHVRSPQQIFKHCQEDTGSREISETPLPRKKPCNPIYSFFCAKDSHG